MVVVIHDLGIEFDKLLREKYENVIHANGQYAPCQGCFKCWTKTPASCFMKDSLQMVSRIGSVKKGGINHLFYYF